MAIIFQTNRLYLREFTIDDGVHFYQMNLDDAVLKHTGDDAFKNVDDARLFLSNYKQYDLHNMGRWAVCLKENDTFIGWCGLKFHPNEKLVEVGYRFYQKHWNKGYATESALASIDYGFNVLKLKEIYAHAHIDNLASHKVIEKCGLHFLNDGDYDGMPAKLYKILNPNYIIKNISAQDTYSVRQPILRAGRPIQDCAFEGDTDETTYHLGLFFKDNLIGVATLMKNSNPLFREAQQYQLRGMAILKNYQKKGLGNLLTQKAEALLAQKQITRLWCNAREIAVSFYKNTGFDITGQSFEIPQIGTHYTMSKKLI